MMKRSAKANWAGTGTDGAGTVSARSAVLDAAPFSFKTRFMNPDGEAGTNPEELLAAAHAGCYAMSLGSALEMAGMTAERIDVEATVTMSEIDGGVEIGGIHLDIVASVPGASADDFEEITEAAKVLCPMSMALHAVAVTLDAKLTDGAAGSS